MEIILVNYIPRASNMTKILSVYKAECMIVYNSKSYTE